MKKIIFILMPVVCMTNFMHAVGSITNNGNQNVNVVIYSSSYQPINAKTNPPRSAQGRVRNQGFVIPPGQNIDLPNNAAYIDVFYSAEKPGIHAPVSPNSSYTLNPDSPTWTITQD